MVMRSARLSGDPVLNQCQAGNHRMLAPEQNLSVMRVQEGLRALGFFDGTLDGIFGPLTGAAVSTYKSSRGLSPTDPVVGPGTSSALDADLFVDPPSLDPAFGELAGFVVGHHVEPFVALELAPLLATPLDSQRHDIGSFLLSSLNSGFLVGIVASSRAGDLAGDPRIPPGVHAQLTNLGTSAGITLPFLGADGQQHEVIVLDDLAVRGQRVLVHRPSGRRRRVELFEVICHELTHTRNTERGFESTPDFDTTTFLDPALAQHFSSATGIPTARVFTEFADEVNARHTVWIVERERAGDPFALNFLAPLALVSAAHFYFAETDPVFMYGDNGYVQELVRRGHGAIFGQLALWLRQTSTMTFSGNAARQELSARLFRDAADVADAVAQDAATPLPGADGLFPLAQNME